MCLQFFDPMSSLYASGRHRTCFALLGHVAFRCNTALDDSLPNRSHLTQQLSREIDLEETHLRSSSAIHTEAGCPTDT